MCEADILWRLLNPPQGSETVGERESLYITQLARDEEGSRSAAALFRATTVFRHAADTVEGRKEGRKGKPNTSSKSVE